jgi:hypothetical protein
MNVIHVVTRLLKNFHFDDERKSIDKHKLIRLEFSILSYVLFEDIIP